MCEEVPYNRLGIIKVLAMGPSIEPDADLLILIITYNRIRAVIDGGYLPVTGISLRCVVSICIPHVGIHARHTLKSRDS